MKVTKLTVSLLNGLKAKASATIVVDDCLKVRGIKIFPRKQGKGLFVAYPETRNGRGDYFSLVFPVTKEFRKELDTLILNEYNRVLKEKKAVNNPSEAEDFEQPLEVPDEE